MEGGSTYTLADVCFWNRERSRGVDDISANRAPDGPKEKRDRTSEDAAAAENCTGNSSAAISRTDSMVMSARGRRVTAMLSPRWILSLRSVCWVDMVGAVVEKDLRVVRNNFEVITLKSRAHEIAGQSPPPPPPAARSSLDRVSAASAPAVLGSLLRLISTGYVRGF